MQQLRNNDRHVPWDVTRAIACAMVVMVHVSAVDFYAFSPLWVPSVVFDSLCRVAVPLFLMLSGALLLRKDEPVLRFYRKRLPRLAQPMLFWTIVYAYIGLPGDRQTPPANYLVHYLFMYPYEHLWYLYTSFGLSLAIPYLGRMFRNSTNNEVRVFIALWFLIACVLNQASFFLAESWDPSQKWGTQLFSGFAGFLMLGAYLERCRPAISNTICAFVYLTSSVAIMLATYFYSTHIGQPNEFFFSYLTPLVVLSSVSAYLLLTGLPTISSSANTLIKLISDCSLGIYCIHPMLIRFFVHHWHLNNRLNSVWLSIPVLWAAVFTCAGILVFVLRMIPTMHRII